jgi:hypothetical protein
LGDDFLVGSPFNFVNGVETGTVYRIDSITGEIEQAYVTPTPPGRGDAFGFSVGAVRGNVLVGAIGVDTNSFNNNVGAVYLLDAENGSNLQTYRSPVSPDQQVFGRSIAVVGSSILVGTDGAGAYLFEGPSTGGLPTAVALIALGSRWKYLDNGSNPGTAWRASGFNDSAWSEGLAELGYGDNDEATVVNCGPSSPTCNANNFATTYFRAHFNVEDVALISQLTATLIRDDAAAVYLNGVEVYRDSNIAANAAFNTFASAASADNAVAVFAIPSDQLMAGDNVMAVEIHQAAANSSDISFDLRLTATTVIPEPSPMALSVAGIVLILSTKRCRRPSQSLR